jgi:hypothetical protein
LETAVSLSVLVPDHVGITLQSQPHLYWFISKKTTQPIEFTITEKDAVKPLLEARLKPLEKRAFSASVWRTTVFNCGPTSPTNGLWPWSPTLLAELGTSCPAV